jgi:hypothetical protein
VTPLWSEPGLSPEEAFMTTRRWQDGINGVLGFWMLMSPSILGFATTSRAIPTAWILGFAIIVFAVIAVYMPKAWEEVVNILLGIGPIASPWVLAYADQARPTANAVVAGLLVTAFAIWAMLMDAGVQRWWHDRHVPH